MLTAILLLVFATYTVAAPGATKLDPVVVNNDNKYGYAVDLSQEASTITADLAKCLKSNGIQAVFIRGFKWDQNAIDAASVASVRNTYQAGLGVEIFMHPSPMSSLEGSQQLDLMVRGLNNNGIVVRTVWITVENLNWWPTDQIKNTVFINSILTRANQLGLTVGIFTSAYSWSKITNNWNAGPDVLLWYNNSPSAANFDDFVAFGGFKTPLVKMFDLHFSPCSTNFNRNVYSIGIAAKKSFTAPDGKIVVGGL